MRFTILVIATFIMFIILTGCTKDEAETLKKISALESSSNVTTLAGCKKVSDQDARELCISRIAVGSNNPEICQEIQQQPGITHCYFIYYEEKPSLELCSKMIQEQNQYKDLCNQNEAIITANEALCNEISDDTLKSSCISSAEFQRSYKELCPQFYSGTEKDPRNKCAEYIYSLGREDLCKKLAQEYERQRCLELAKPAGAGATPDAAAPKESAILEFSKLAFSDKCSFGANKCQFYIKENKEISIKLKNTDYPKSPIKIIKEISVDKCTSASYLAINGGDFFNSEIKSDEEYVVRMSCSEQIDTKAKMIVTINYLNQDTGLTHKGTIFLNS
jgi:hypothetical protein